MILVSLGTQDREFKRLLEAIEKEIIRGNINEKVIVQAGETTFQSEHMELFDLIPSEEFLKLLDECSILICHGGVGTIIDGLKRHKKIIAAARLKEFGEHQNNHQKQIIHEFVEKHLILELDDFDKLDEKLKEIKDFTPKEYESNTLKFIEPLKQYIEDSFSNEKESIHRKFMLYFFFGVFAFFIEWIFLFFFSKYNPIFVFCCTFFLFQFYQIFMHILFFRDVPYCFKKEIFSLFLWLISFLMLWCYPQMFSKYFIIKILGIKLVRFFLLFFFSSIFKISDTE